MILKFIPFLLSCVVLCGTMDGAWAQSAKPLTPPGEGAAVQKTEGTPNTEAEKPASKPVPGLRQLLIAIGILALLFVVLIGVLKQFRPKEAGQLPKDVFEVLGKSPLAFRQQVYYLRCGNRVFVLSLSANGVDKIGEITESTEVDRITRRCHGEMVPSTPSSTLPPQAASPTEGQTFEEIYRQVLKK